MIADPPFEEGACHERDTWPFPPVATRFCGADGIEGTVTVIVADWVRVPLVPVTMTAYLPEVAGADMLNVSVAEPPAGTVTDGFASVAEPDAADADSDTVPLKLLTDDIVIVVLPEPLGDMVSEEGLDDTEKLGVGGPLRYGIRLFAWGLPSPVTSSYPGAALHMVPQLPLLPDVMS